MPKLTDDQISDKLEEVKKIRFFLDPDPTVTGLNSLLVKLAELQIQKDRVSYMVTDAMQNLAIHEIEKEVIQGEHDRQLDLLMATDATVQGQKSADMRNTHARMKMPELVLKLHHADVSHIKAGWYLKILQSVMSNLESANSNLSRQITVLQLSTNLGEMPNRGSMKHFTV
jgi:hypothetical protein